MSSPSHTAEVVRALKLAANETRFRIITLLVQAEDGICVGDIAADIHMSHSATSHQLARLESGNIVTSERTGQTVCYQIADTPEARILSCIITRCLSGERF